VTTASPTITGQPAADTTVTEGDAATFAVEATDATGYTWYLDGVQVASGSNSYTISSMAEGDTGTYTVEVSNEGGTATATFDVHMDYLSPEITQDPTDQHTSNGGSATFSVTASGTSLRYQWLMREKNRSVALTMEGETSSTLTLSGLSRSEDTSQYSCIVKNPEDEQVVSAWATLYVSPQG
jgi:uncharacterized repeat protein (TIGR01451 family)